MPGVYIQKQSEEGCDRKASLESWVCAKNELKARPSRKYCARQQLYGVAFAEIDDLRPRDRFAAVIRSCSIWRYQILLLSKGSLASSIGEKQLYNGLLP